MRRNPDLHNTKLLERFHAENQKLISPSDTWNVTSLLCNSMFGQRFRTRLRLLFSVAGCLSMTLVVTLDCLQLQGLIDGR